MSGRHIMLLLFLSCKHKLYSHFPVLWVNLKWGSPYIYLGRFIACCISLSLKVVLLKPGPYTWVLDFCSFSNPVPKLISVTHNVNVFFSLTAPLTIKEWDCFPLSSSACCHTYHSTVVHWVRGTDNQRWEEGYFLKCRCAKATPQRKWNSKWARGQTELSRIV